MTPPNGLNALHVKLLSIAIERSAGKAEKGTMAFVRSLAPNVIEALASDKSFEPMGWKVRRVAAVEDAAQQTITADQAVELRENKGKAVLLLVDVAQAGAGMDGIYSAAQEIDEKTLFSHALDLAAAEITHKHDRRLRVLAERAVKVARGHGNRYSLSRWVEFDFYTRVAGGEGHPFELLTLLGLWPATPQSEFSTDDTLRWSRLFIDRLLSVSAAALTPAQRIASLRLVKPTTEQVNALERFLRAAVSKPLLEALRDLQSQPALWLHELRPEEATDEIQSVKLTPWRKPNDTLQSWSRLMARQGDKLAELILDEEAERSGTHAKLEVRWTARPVTMLKDAAEYQVAIFTDMDQEIVTRQVSHSAKGEEKCRFTYDDFQLIDENALIAAKVVVSVVGASHLRDESEEFIIRFGEAPDRESAGVGKKVRALSEGLINLRDRSAVTSFIVNAPPFLEDTRGFVQVRTPEDRRSYRVYRPPLIREVERQWCAQQGAIGRWRVKVRTTGARAAEPEFVPLDVGMASDGGDVDAVWKRASDASRRMAERFALHTGVGQLYDQDAKSFDIARNYVAAWTALLDAAAPGVSLANTVEVQLLSGQTVGLIVLPSHPLRVAWQCGYDNLMLHCRYSEKARPKEIEREFKPLDGAMFPAFLPGLRPDECFVFADTLGFHAVAMVPDKLLEPKAAVAILARAMGEAESLETTPYVENQSAEVLSDELIKYFDSHNNPTLMHLHALRPGDGMTVARALGRMQEKITTRGGAQDDGDDVAVALPSYVLELYPSSEQRGVAGRFISEAREKRRSGAGVLAAEDRWMLESSALPGGINLPRLRWARKETDAPEASSHVALAFDTFESGVQLRELAAKPGTRPLHAYGLVSAFERNYASRPVHTWTNSLPAWSGGLKHPADPAHSDRLIRLQGALSRVVARHLGDGAAEPVLLTEIEQEKGESILDLHRLSDWVITLDRNAGVEYFDSPLENSEIYDAYVIDVVPEREDLGCLQLITSSSNLVQMRGLMGDSLTQMGILQNRPYAVALLEQLKAFSGRLAIQMTGNKPPAAEVVALALSYANCRATPSPGSAWYPLHNGLLIAVDEIAKIIEPLNTFTGLADGAPHKDEETFNSSEAWRTNTLMLYVSLLPRKGLSFQFAEVRYQPMLRLARDPSVLLDLDRRLSSVRKRWQEWFSNNNTPESFRALRAGRLARLLRFYADRARRHYLSTDRHARFLLELNRMLAEGDEYDMEAAEEGDRGWIFCPEFLGGPMELAPPGWETRVFIAGVDLPEATPVQAPVTTDQSRRTSLIEQVRSETSLDAAPVTAAPQVAPAKPSETARTEDVDERRSSRSTPEQSASERPLSEAPVAIMLGNDSTSGNDVRWDVSIRGNPHLLIAGLPGMGKTTCLINVCRQLFERKVMPIVFSYHSDFDERVDALGLPVRFVDFDGLGFNPLSVTDRTARNQYLDVAGSVRDIFSAIYPELGNVQLSRLRDAVVSSYVEKGWAGRDANLEALEEPEFRRFLEILRSDPRPDQGLRAMLGRLGELDDYRFFDRSPAPLSLWESHAITIVRLHATQNEVLQNAFSSLVFYGLYKEMFRRGVQQRITHAVVFDEAHRAARLKLIGTMAKECRKYGIALLLASQEAKDFQQPLYSAVAGYLVLRLIETDAKAIAGIIATSDQERFYVDRIKQLQAYSALFLQEGMKRPVQVKLTA